MSGNLSWLIWIGFLLGSLGGFAQLSVRGIIRDKNSGKPLTGANINLENTFISTTSDDKGSYSFHLQKPGEYLMRISFMGFRTLTLDVRFTKDTLMDFNMETSPILGEEVNIIATRAQSKTPMAYSSVTLPEIRDVNLGEDLPYIIDNTPSDRKSVV